MYRKELLDQRQFAFAVAHDKNFVPTSNLARNHISASLNANLGPDDCDLITGSKCYFLAPQDAPRCQVYSYGSFGGIQHEMAAHLSFTDRAGQVSDLSNHAFDQNLIDSITMSAPSS